MTNTSPECWLTGLGPCDWGQLRQQLGGDGSWLWLSMDPTNPLGLSAELPERQPPGITHVWGWTDALLVRARVDQHLPDGGVVGARLHLHGHQPTADAELVRPRVERGQTWARHDGRINADPHHPALGLRGLTQYLVRRTSTASDGTMTVVPLTFMALDGEASRSPSRT